MVPMSLSRFRASARSLPWRIAAIAAISGCGGGGGVGRTVVVDGSSTVYPISQAAQESYSQAHPGARIKVGFSGTGGGFGRYVEGEVDIVDASRPAKPEEEAAAEAKGYDWTRFIVAHDGITVAVNPKNDWVDALTVDQLREIFRPGSPITTWADINPDWPDQEITLYTPDDDSGTYDSFVEDALGLEPERTEDVNPSSDDNTLVNGVANDVNGLGYFGFAYYTDHQDKLKAVPIQPGPDAEPVAPTMETILGGQYQPLSRPLFIHVKNASLRRPEVADFVTFYLKNVEDLARKGGYVPPTEQERRENLEKLEAALGQEAETVAE